MTSIRERILFFIKTTLIGGLGVILPIVILVIIFSWLFGFVIKYVHPISEFIFADPDAIGIFADVISILLIVLIWFLIGLIVRTAVGRYLHTSIEGFLLGKIPGYNIVKDVIEQFIGKKATPFSSVVLVNMGNGTLLTGFVTAEHADGRCTVFIPTGPNPTSGNILHVPPENVFKIDVPVEQAMKTIISAGAGSDELIKKYVIAMDDHSKKID